jgi:uncharacterized protein involved in outer membrane biogenesis
MKWVKRVLLALFALILLLLLLALAAGFMLHRYVQSPAFAARVSQEATTFTGVPVKFERLRMDWGEGISVFQLQVENPKAPVEPILFSIHKIAVRFNLFTVFSPQPEITSLTFDQPELKVTQNDAGQYVLPTVAPSSAVTPGSAEEKKASQTAFSIKGVSLERGLLQIKNPDQTIKLRLSGLQTNANVDLAPEKGLAAFGKLQIEEMILAAKFKATALQAPFRIEKNTLSLTDMAGTLYGGKLSGGLELSLSDAQLPYKFVLNAENVDVNQALTELVARPGVLSGRLEAKTSWLGPANDPMGLSGQGTAEIRNGQLIAVPLFRLLGEILQIKALLQPDFQEIKTAFSVESQVVNLSTFQVKAALFDMTGQGTVGFDQTLNLQITLGLNPEITRQIPQQLEDRLVARADGYRTLSFNVTGTTDDPKIDLLQQLLKQEADKLIDQGLNKLKGLFGPKKADPAPAPVPPPAAPAPAAP